MDVARTARRLGADEAMIVYRRSRKEMPAHEFEAQEAEEEGILIHWLRTITQIDETHFTVEKMQIDAAGKPQPTGEFEMLEADTLVLALGQDVDTGFLERVPGVAIARDGVVSGGRADDDGPRRAVRRRRHGAGGTHRHRRHRPRQEGRAPHRRLAARIDAIEHAPTPARSRTSSR